MAWEFTLLDASFRGISFDIENIGDEISRDVQSHQYPYVDGADQEDLGRNPREVTMTAVFTGVFYEMHLNSFIGALNEKGHGELIHPVFGVMPQMQVLKYRIEHSAEDYDFATVSVTWIEHQDSSPFFTLQLPGQLGDVAGLFSDNALTAGIKLFNDAISGIRYVTGIAARLNAIRGVAKSILTSIKSLANDVIYSGQDLINFPSALFSDVSAGVSSLISRKKFEGESIVSNYINLTDEVNDIIALPEALVKGVVSERFLGNEQQIINNYESPLNLNISANDLAILKAVVALSVVTVLIEATTDILIDQLESTELSAFDIESITNKSRHVIQTVIDTQRIAYPIEQSRTVTENLKDAALQIQKIALTIIESRPPLIKHTIQVNTNLHLLAHHLYNDYSRSVEIIRLNPQIRNPNFVMVGEVLNVYAK